MAGRSLEKRVRAELGKLASAVGCTVALYVHDWVADGKTLAALSEKVGCSRSFLSRILNGDPELREALEWGRKEQAEKMAEDSLGLVDDLADKEDLSSQDVQLAKERVNVRKWLSAMNSPERFAAKQEAMTLNIGELHLDALKKVRTVEHQPHKALPDE